MEKITNEVALTEKKVNKKGFSLVELIVVIAIMAILVGIVGMQVLPYIERSKETKDMELMDTLCTAAVSAFTMNADKITATDYTIAGASSALSPKQADDGTDVVDTIKELMGNSGAGDIDDLIKDDLDSKKGKAIETFTISFDGDTGVVTVTPIAKKDAKEVLDPISSRGGSTPKKTTKS
jgi:type IV pilus assembly protein PilA